MPDSLSEPLPRACIAEPVETLDLPTAAWRRAAAVGAASQARHHQLMEETTCLNTLRVVQPDRHTHPTEGLRVAAWNLERCKHVEETAALLDSLSVDICLLTEMDLGMARSGNRDTTADLTRLLGLGHAYGVEFIELGHGDAREEAAHGDTANLAGLHGNAVASRYPIDKAVLLPLDAGGAWFTGNADNTQRRIGGRMAIALRLRLPSPGAQPIWFIAAHYESRLGPLERETETQVLLSQIQKICSDEPVLLGGDFNCKGIQAAGLTGAEVLTRPETAEPMFNRLAAAGFDWQTCNTAEETTRPHPWHDTKAPKKKIDWFFARGLTCSGARVVPAVNPDGENLSDHELILVDVALQQKAET